MPRTNHAGVTENAEYKIDKEKYGEHYTEIFGEKPSPFCDKCGMRHAFCECVKKEEDKVD